MSEIDEIILESLSFFDPMTKEQLILDMDQIKLKKFDDFNMEELEKCLKRLKKEGLLKEIKGGEDLAYIKITSPRRSWWRRLLRLLQIK